MFPIFTIHGQQQVVGVVVVVGGERLAEDCPLPPGEWGCHGNPTDVGSNPDHQVGGQSYAGLPLPHQLVDFGAAQ